MIKEIIMILKLCIFIFQMVKFLRTSYSLGKRQLEGGTGADDHDFLPFGLRLGVMVKWKKIFDQDQNSRNILHSQMVKIGNSLTWPGPKFMKNCGQRVKLVNFDRLPWKKFQGVMV